MQLDVKQINEILTNLSEYDLKRRYTQVAKSEPEDYWHERSQGDYSIKTEVYKLNIEDLHLKVYRQTDSYGDNEYLSGVSFVFPITKQVVDFE